MNLKSHFQELATQYSNDGTLTEKLWAEINKKYTAKSRHYHNLVHLQNLLLHLSEVKEYIEDWNAVLFSLFYHDIVYNVLKNNNEEKSAALARARMKELNVPHSCIDRCTAQILATKKHEPGPDQDSNYFTDTDLSILGAPWDIYEQYFEHVRKEYSIYPDMIYKPGRKKVLKHFMDTEAIYKTTFFYDKFEHSAKANLAKELELLK